MRSFRLDSALESRVERAAAARGESVSEFIRQAAAERADATMTLADPVVFDDVLGVVRGGGGRARKSGVAFTEVIAIAAHE